MAEAVEAGRADHAAQLRQWARLSRRQRRLPRHERAGARLRRPALGRLPPIQEAGGHVRKGEKGTPIMYVEWRQQRTARDDNGNPVLDDEGRRKLEWVQRDRPIVKLHYVFNVEQTEGLKLRSLAEAAPEWEGHERAEALIRSSGVRLDHVAGDRAYCSLKDDRVVLPDKSQFESQSAYTHTALHELGHATGHPNRLNRPTLVKHGGFGSEAYAREELRAEIAAMMTGEQLGVGHEPRHGTAYVGSWTKALESDPKEIRAAAVDAQRISDCLMARERDRTVEEEQNRDGPDAGQAARAPGREVAPERGDGAPVVPGAGERPATQADESHARAASPRPALSDAQPTPSVPVHDAGPDWSQSQEPGPSR